MKLTRTLFNFLLLVGFASVFFSSSGGRNDNRAGAPGDSGTCGSCHSSNTTGNILLFGVPAAYTPGAVYPLTITVNQTGGQNTPVGGFQLTATDGVNNTPVGSFSVTPGETRIQNTGRLVQSTPKATSGNSVSWTTNWTAPAAGSAPANLVFYYSGIAANGNGGSGGGDYAFSGNSAAVLPVDLVSFIAEKQKNAVELKWETAAEINHDFFAVERSTDDSMFETVDKVYEAEFTTEDFNTYHYADEDLPAEKVVYYRLKQTDLDGAFAYSPVRAVSLRDRKMSIFPNPVRINQDITVLLTAPNYEEKTFTLRNTAGQIVYQNSVSLTRGENRVVLSPQNLPRGIYFLETEGEQGLQKVMVE